MLGLTVVANEVEQLDLDHAEFADNTLTIGRIEQQWHNRHFFMADRNTAPRDIKRCFVSFAQAYPNEFFNLVMCHLLGFETDGFISGFVCDERNGYIAAEQLTELSQSVQMCYWKCTNGDIIVGIALQGEEYTDERYGDGPPVRSVNDLMFFKVEKGEVMWLPKTPRQMLGRDYDFTRYDIALPRVGKDITLTPKGRVGKTVVLRWNGKDFR